MHVITKPISDVIAGVRLVAEFLEVGRTDDIGKIREALDDVVPMLEDLRAAISEERVAEAVERASA